MVARGDIQSTLRVVTRILFMASISVPRRDALNFLGSARRKLYFTSASGHVHKLSRLSLPPPCDVDNLYPLLLSKLFVFHPARIRVALGMSRASNSNSRFLFSPEADNLRTRALLTVKIENCTRGHVYFAKNCRAEEEFPKERAAPDRTHIPQKFNLAIVNDKNYPGVN